jgi:PAS domain S-box-containing protein
MRPLKLLLVEDSQVDTELVLAELRRGGFDASIMRVDTEVDLRKALREEDWELVLCDHGLPSFSSMEALQVTSEAAADVPFVILSGTIGEEAAVEALRAGARDVVLKTNLGRLAPVVDRVLLDADNRRHQAQLAHERDELEVRLIRANDELRESERQYRLLFESNPQPMAVYDRETLEIVTVNEEFVTNYGYTRSELLAMTVAELGPAEDVALLLAALPTNPDGVKPADMGGIAGRPWRHIYKDGTVIEVEATSANLMMGPRACRIALFHNVTERNRAFGELAIARDEAVEASNMKSAFLANVSHEVRTPMNGVIGMTELLLDTKLTDEQREYASQVWRSGEQMLAIVNDILDLSKIEGGHLELEIADFDPHHTIGDVCAGAMAQARAKGLALSLELDDLVPHCCRGDGRRLGQVLLNLLSNAIKFTADGSIDVRVDATPAPDRRSRVRVEVTDSGIGMAPDTLERMFEPFTQADVSTTRHYGGSGLGLAIAREILDMMGGVIGARSEAGQGSSFWFEVELPVPDAAEAPSAPPLPPGATAAAWTRQPLLLVAEDSAVNQIVAARALERCGCRTHVVSDGREAVEAFATGTYDAVLLDCQMPNVDGYQATAEIRELESGGRRTPIIAMTAHAMEGEYRRCLDAGMDDHITKPMRHAELAEKLLRWIPEDAHAGASDEIALRDGAQTALTRDGAR